MFISRAAGIEGTLLLAWSPAAEVIMTRTALRRGPAARPARAGARRLDHGELLSLVRSEPIGSAEVARHLGVSDEDLLDARRADLFHAPSLDAPLPQTEGMGRLADLLGGEDPRLALAVDVDAVSAHWAELPVRQRRILLMRFYRNMTQAQIGARLGISQMHVSRLQAAALSYLRDRLLGQEPAAAPPPPSGSTLTQTRRQA